MAFKDVKACFQTGLLMDLVHVKFKMFFFYIFRKILHFKFKAALISYIYTVNIVWLHMDKTQQQCLKCPNMSPVAGFNIQLNIHLDNVTTYHLHTLN